MITVTVRYGATGELTREFTNGTTAGSVLSNTGIQAALGFGSNVQAVVEGQVLRNETPLSNGDVVTVETRANSKA